MSEPDEPDEYQRWYLNHYYCEDCDLDWTDEWDCQCDNECPNCGADYTPVRSEEIAP